MNKINEQIKNKSNSELETKKNNLVRKTALVKAEIIKNKKREMEKVKSNITELYLG